MRHTLLFTFMLLLLAVSDGYGKQVQKPVVYLIPGQGADARLYKNLDIDSTFEVRDIKYSIPDKKWDMRDYAMELALQIDTTRKFSIVGVSLGGMLATEMNEFLNAENIIVISGAKSRKEFPFRYRFQKTIPLHKITPGFLMKFGAKVLQPIFEPDRKKDKETFKAMLSDKDPRFLNRTVTMIVEWERKSYRDNIVHIHGDYDNTIPLRNVDTDYIVKEGSHMMVLTKGALISEIINGVLLEGQ